MKAYRNKLALLLAVAMLCGLFTGCGAKDETVAGKETPAPAIEETEAPAPTGQSTEPPKAEIKSGSLLSRATPLCPV